ncbi:MAG: hypothetical protein M2R45_02368 [Verrucomicrobia subdivision 3 bacterium]|nr:hypothetical protein [Limisphaerales bacterium]MCS1414919.1 hypothetical protein [Limisphaerales bacterium]
MTHAQETAEVRGAGRKCKKCGGQFPIGDMEGDHIKPWREGGTTTDDNLQMLCRPCNREKG